MSPKGKDDGDIWEDILSSLQSTSSNRGNKTLVVLGAASVGKSSLIARLAGVRDVTNISSGVGLEFSYLTVKDEGDLVGRIGVYATSSKHFLPHVLTKERLSNCVVVLMLSLCEPWSIDDQIFYWSSSLEQHMKDLKLEDKELATLQHSIADRFASYILPESEGDQILLPVPEGALTTNIGLPLIVLLSKVDNITNLQKNYDYDEEHFDYIQWYLRKFCLEWGAGLLYTSPRENSNCQLFMDYICHVLYEMKFSEFAQGLISLMLRVPLWSRSRSR